LLLIRKSAVTVTDGAAIGVNPMVLMISAAAVPMPATAAQMPNALANANFPATRLGL
jgi:hypothetical protein